MSSRGGLDRPGVSLDSPMYIQQALNSIYRVKEKLRTGELSVAGDQWPIFLYNSYKYDDNDPWKGLLQSSILVKASRHFL